MGSLPETPGYANVTVTIFEHDSHNYDFHRPIRLKVYQTFIFSIPILLSAILILLFYLLYLKRRSRRLSSAPDAPPSSAHGSPFNSVAYNEMYNREMQIRLPKVILNEHLREKDPLCSVCLGEYEMREELVQVRVCKHMFHTECIKHWLKSNATCPLCRSPVLSSASKFFSKSTTTQQHQPANSLAEEASSSSSSPSSSMVSGIIARDFNDAHIELPVALNIIVHN